jgi:hypothetical protein
LEKTQGQNMSNALRIWTAMVGAGSDIFTVDVIEHEGKKWLVPLWLDNTDEGWSTPARIILLDLLKHQHVPSGKPADYILNDPVPINLLEADQDQSPIAIGYVVVHRPEIRLPLSARWRQ